MATRKMLCVEVVTTTRTVRLGRGQGALGNFSSPPVPGAASSLGNRSVASLSSSSSSCSSESTSSQDKVLEVRVTEIVDVTSFWVQLGTGELRKTCRAWQGGSAHQ